jgi:dihydropteroate synthase
MDRASQWQLRTRSLDFGLIPKIMGILNVTPDSFSDGGRFYSTQIAVDQALRMEDDGADIIDIGGESTRPYSEPVDADTELHRVVPVIEAIQSRIKVPLSIDTTKAAVARAAIALGAEIINDISGLESDPAMTEVAVESRAGICAMHMQGSPQTMQDNPQYENVVTEIESYLALRLTQLLAAGIDRSRICLDPGIGFGKTHEHNLELLRSAAVFHRLGCPILIGHSRKGFMAKVLNDKTADRTFATLGVSLALAQRGIQVLRVHDVVSTRQGLLLFEAAGGFEPSVQAN